MQAYFSITWTCIGALWGAIFGSFLTVATTRGAEAVAAGASISGFWRSLVDRSHCPHCHARIQWRHLVPVFSYLALGGKCACCSHPIPLRYFLMEVVTMILGAIAFHSYGSSWASAQCLLLVVILIAIAEIDTRTSLIPDAFTIPMVMLGVAFRVMHAEPDWKHVLVETANALEDATLGYFIPVIFSDLYGRIRKIQIPLGRGDAKLLSMLCVWFGFWAFLPVMFVGNFLFCIHSAFRRKGLTEHAPMGPWLCLPSLALLLPAVQSALADLAGGILWPSRITLKAFFMDSWFSVWAHIVTM